MLQTHLRCEHRKRVAVTQLDPYRLPEPLVLTPEVFGNLAVVNHTLDERMILSYASVSSAVSERSEAINVMISQRIAVKYFTTLPPGMVRQSQESYETEQLAVLAQHFGN